jgi:hypothetical protein
MDLDVIAARPMCVRRADISLELLAQRGRPDRATGHIVAHMKHTRRTRRGREQRIEGRDAPRVGRRHAEAETHVLEARLADPADALLERAERGEQQVALLARHPSADGDMRIALVAALSAIPRRLWCAQQSIDRGTL